MRVVLDPNVVISALVSRGTTYAVWRRWLDDASAYMPVTCPMLLAELEKVLARPKFASIAADTRQDALDRLSRDAEFVEDPPVVVGATDDPKDDYLVALAKAAAVDGVVSGDPHIRRAGEVASKAQALLLANEAAGPGSDAKSTASSPEND